jgi:hypothetical protein
MSIAAVDAGKTVRLYMCSIVCNKKFTHEITIQMLSFAPTVDEYCSG